MIRHVYSVDASLFRNPVLLIRANVLHLYLILRVRPQRRIIPNSSPSVMSVILLLENVQELTLLRYLLGKL